MVSVSPDFDIDRVLRERFGFDAFQPGQREGIEALLGGGSLLSIQPTGHGKSLLYQLPAAVLSGMTIVVSPLLALVRDQVGQLNDRFGIPAASINSDQSDEENEAARRAAAEQRVRLLFVSPEHLDHVERFEEIARLPVALLVVDEAHCISTWGHDFRPAYRQIVRLVQALRERVPGVRVLALTATADARVEDDIRCQLEGPGAPKLTIHRRSMDRPNIALAVVPVEGMAHKLAYLAKLVPRLPRPGILYCATRERTELVAEYLRMRGVDAAAYHAGLEPERKVELQGDFLRGRYAVIAATNALGMGIDKSDLRYVIHVDLPGSITAYYQEVGRAGRDGQPARGILLRDAEDRRIQEHFIGSAQPEARDFEAVLAAVRGDGEPPGLTAIKIRTGQHPTRVTVVVAELCEQGFLEKRAKGKQVYLPTGKPGMPDLERYRRQNEVRVRELGAMLRFGNEESGCLMATLRRALGDGEARACGRCSMCKGQRSTVELGDEIATAAAWLEGRASPIAESARPPMSEGLAILDGDVGGRLFGWWMNHREEVGDAGVMPEDLMGLITARVQELGSRHTFAAVVVVPSRRWAQREAVAQRVADVLGVPALVDALVWREMPAEQGTLSNNDQRRQNVDGKMRIGSGLTVRNGDLLLLDDLIGSGATLREAGRALRKEAKWKEALVPLVIARVRRRLGAPGE
ncbi:MAG: ATP-dependent DNA helicase RecQ [Polyangiaceae bacterium]|nr:ATP-dependent DNA helicase RecQ [Polyangiaceae bacterium]